MATSGVIEMLSTKGVKLYINRPVALVEGAYIELSFAEHNVLRTLMLSAGELVAYEELIESSEARGRKKKSRKEINRLVEMVRYKLDHEGFVLTIRDRGYMIEDDEPTYHSGDIVVTCSGASVFGNTISLSKQQRAFLEMLLAADREILPDSQIMWGVWGEEVDEDRLFNLANKLRSKLLKV